METLFLKNRIYAFLLQCLSLASPLTRVVTIAMGVITLSCFDIGSLKLPNLCIWEVIFGYCPANGTTRALNAFFHGKWEEAVGYNLNILAVIPVIISIFVVDMARLVKAVKMVFKNAGNCN